MSGNRFSDSECNRRVNAPKSVLILVHCSLRIVGLSLLLYSPWPKLVETTVIGEDIHTFLRNIFLTAKNIDVTLKLIDL